jgi:hypothetical protein
MKQITIVHQNNALHVAGVKDNGEIIEPELTESLQTLIFQLIEALDEIKTPEEEFVVYGIQAKRLNAMLAQDLPDENKLKVPLLFETFDALLGETVQKGFVFRHNGVLYRVEQPELTFVEHYSPEQEGLDALFTKLQEEQVAGGIIDWFVPTSTNYYKLGDLMRFTDGLVYESIYESSNGSNANIWSPVEYPAGWKRRPDLDQGGRQCYQNPCSIRSLSKNHTRVAPINLT